VYHRDTSSNDPSIDLTFDASFLFIADRNARLRNARSREEFLLDCKRNEQLPEISRDFSRRASNVESSSFELTICSVAEMDLNADLNGDYQTPAFDGDLFNQRNPLFSYENILRPLSIRLESSMSFLVSLSENYCVVVRRIPGKSQISRDGFSDARASDAV